MQDNDVNSIIANPNKKKGKTGLIIGIIAILVLVAGVGVGIYLVGQNQEIRNQAAKFKSCSEDACTKCILDGRPDILPFYDENGWSTSCANQTKIVNNWCGPTVDPNSCQTIKTGQCATACAATTSQSASPSPTATATSQAAATSSPSPSATSSSTNAPSATPTNSPSPAPTSTQTPAPTATNRVSVITTDQEIPQTGVGTPVLLGGGLGILLLIGAFILAL